MRRGLYRLNGTVLSCRLNALNCISSRRSAGKLFHTRGPAKEKNSCHRKCCGSVVGSMSCQWQNENFGDHDRQPVECQQWSNVCLSVRLSERRVVCDKTKKSLLPIFWLKKNNDSKTLRLNTDIGITTYSLPVDGRRLSWCSFTDGPINTEPWKVLSVLILDALDTFYFLTEITTF